jgi:hypothetical protein
LSKTFDELTRSIKDVTDHSLPILDEAKGTVVSTNAQLANVDTITTSAAQTAENVQALAGLYAATLGRPLVKVAAFSYGVRQAFGAATDKFRGGSMAGKK